MVHVANRNYIGRSGSRTITLEKDNVNVFRIGVQCSGVVVLEVHFTVLVPVSKAITGKLALRLTSQSRSCSLRRRYRWVASWWSPTSGTAVKIGAKFLLGIARKSNFDMLDDWRRVSKQSGAWWVQVKLSSLQSYYCICYCSASLASSFELMLQFRGLVENNHRI